MDFVGMIWEKEWSAKDWWTDPADRTLERAWQLDMLTMKQGKGVRERWVSLAETRPRKKQATGAQGNDAKGDDHGSTAEKGMPSVALHTRRVWKKTAAEAAQKEEANGSSSSVPRNSRQWGASDGN